MRSTGLLLVLMLSLAFGCRKKEKDYRFTWRIETTKPVINSSTVVCGYGGTTNFIFGTFSTGTTFSNSRELTTALLPIELVMNVGTIKMAQDGSATYYVYINDVLVKTEKKDAVEQNGEYLVNPIVLRYTVN